MEPYPEDERRGAGRPRAGDGEGDGDEGDERKCSPAFETLGMPPRPGEEPVFGITFDGGFGVSADLPLFEEVPRAARQVTTSTGATATVGPKASFGSLSSGDCTNWIARRGPSGYHLLKSHHICGNTHAR